MKGMDWLSERTVFGVLVIGGYYALVIIGMSAKTLSDPAASIVHDAMLTGGPLVGIIVNSIWKSDRADKQNAATMASLANTVATNAAPPSPPA